MIDHIEHAMVRQPRQGLSLQTPPVLAIDNRRDFLSYPLRQHNCRGVSRSHHG